MNSYFNDDLIEEIRVNNDIVDVVSEYVKLDRKGKSMFGLCPFHKEKTASFSVIPSKQIFYCFGCGKGGNVIHFIMNIENLEFVEALRYLADRARINLPEGESEEEKEKAREKKEIIKINTEAARIFFGELNSTIGEKARMYLSKRGIGENTIRKFGIGYSPDAWDFVHKQLIDKGFKEQHIVNSGLSLVNKNGGYYDRFRGRIIFPIFDLRGNVIGFGGRVMDSSMPKYMNSPETLVYNKGRNLYAMNFAKSSGQKRIVIVEGYMDAVSLHQGGITNAVASLGTALTESQGKLLKKYAEEIIISYDADTAGQSATLRGLELLNNIGCNVKVLIIPDGKDPDEFIKKNGSEKFLKLIDRSLSLVEYKIRTLKNQIKVDTTEGKIAFLNKIADMLAKIDNNVEREMYARKIAKDYEISEEAVFSEIIRRIKPRTNFKASFINSGNILRNSVNTKDTAVNEKVSYHERMLLTLLCIDNSLYKTVKSNIDVDDFKDASNREIAAIVFERLDSKKGIVPGELLNLKMDDASGMFAKLIGDECNFEDNGKAMVDIIKKLKVYKLERRQQEILQILSDKNIAGEEVESLKMEMKNIIIERQNI